MPRGRHSGLMLLGAILLVVALSILGNRFAVSFGAAASRFAAPPQDVFETPTSLLGRSPFFPFLDATPIAPGNVLTPLPTITPTPTVVPPTNTPVPTPLPTATPVIPLSMLQRTPAPVTSVLRHPIRLQEGFNIGLYAQGLDSASYMAYAPDGVLFVSLPERGAVVSMETSGDPAVPGRMTVFAQGLTMPTGVTYHDGYVYVAEEEQVVRFPYVLGQRGAAGASQVVVPNLPTDGGFLEHAIGFGPDGKLYLSVGASCNACREADYRRASILRYNADGGNEELLAQGLRDVGDLFWEPQSGFLLATNSSRRRMGDDLPPDTIEHIVAGSNYGWPFCHAGNIVDPELGWPEACVGVPQPFQQVPAQTTPRGLLVYSGQQFPAEYQGDVFVALYGSWERQVPVGYTILRVNVENGEVVGQEEFASGWLVQGSHWGRPVDLIQAPDGSLLVSDDEAGAIYRIYHEGP